MAYRRTDLTAEEVRRTFDYDHETGNLIWISAPKNLYLLNRVAGCRHGSGYVHIEALGRGSFLAHRLVWLWVYGEWPKNEIDHINCDKGDNRIENLREADRTSNSENRRTPHSNNYSGFLGVTWDRTNKSYQARIMVGGKSNNLGRFKDPESASQAYLAAKRKLHGGCSL